MRLTMTILGAALLAVGCRGEADRPDGANGVSKSSDYAGKDLRPPGDDLQERAPEFYGTNDAGVDGGPVPGAQPTLNPEAQDPKGRGRPQDPRMVPGSPASEKELTPPKP